MHFHSIKEDTKCSFVQTYLLKKGFKKFRHKSKDRACKEINQLRNRIAFELAKLEDFNQDKINKAIESLIFVAKKRDETAKGKTCTNSSIQ